MNLAYFIARRTARPAPGEKPGVMERIAVISVALSVTVMILTIAVIMGFKREVTEKITAFTAHATLTDLRSANSIDSAPVHCSEHLEALMRETPSFRSSVPYAVCGGIVRTDDAVEGVVLKGVDTTYDLASFEAWLVEGELPRIGAEPRTKDILLSRSLAKRLSLTVGDRPEMLFVTESQPPRRDRFKIAGLYDSGMEEMDRVTVLTDLRNVQRLCRWSDDEVTGYEIYVDDLADVDRYTDALIDRLAEDESDETLNLIVTTVTERYPNIFDWLKAHDVNAVVIIVIMLLVAFFNMATALLVLVLARTRMIGLLKALGMRHGLLRRIFLYRAMFVALRGLAWGNAVGLSLCWLQATTHLVHLNAEGYLLSAVPIAVDWRWWLLLNVGTLLTTGLLMLLPTAVISTVKPEETIRYE